jgi:hypothetical protein
MNRVSSVIVSKKLVKLQRSSGAFMAVPGGFFQAGVRHRPKPN